MLSSFHPSWLLGPPLPLLLQPFLWPSIVRRLSSSLFWSDACLEVYYLKWPHHRLPCLTACWHSHLPAPSLTPRACLPLPFSATARAPSAAPQPEATPGRWFVIQAVSDVEVLELDASVMGWAVEHDYRLESELHRAVRARRKVLAAVEEESGASPSASASASVHSSNLLSSSSAQDPSPPSSPSAPSTMMHSPRIGEPQRTGGQEQWA